MINIKHQVPSIYYDASRDFQLLGHLYEVVLNYTKTNADMLYLLPNGIEADTRTTELLATTLGFKLRRNYDKAQLAALVSIFPQLLKIKGTKQAIDLAGNALVKASGVPGVFSSELENHILTINIPIELSDITLIMDLLPYILPFGIRVSVVRTTRLKQEVSLPIGATAVIRKALPGIGNVNTENGWDIIDRHPLGLANVTKREGDGHLVVDYSNSSFINPTDGTAIAGMFGTSPIIAFDPKDTSSASVDLIDKEENT
jgi:hypothetical protein